MPRIGAQCLYAQEYLARARSLRPAAEDGRAKVSMCRAPPASSCTATRAPATRWITSSCPTPSRRAVTCAKSPICRLKRPQSPWSEPSTIATRCCHVAAGWCARAGAQDDLQAELDGPVVVAERCHGLLVLPDADRRQRLHRAHDRTEVLGRADPPARASSVSMRSRSSAWNASSSPRRRRQHVARGPASTASRPPPAERRARRQSPCTARRSAASASATRLDGYRRRAGPASPPAGRRAAPGAVSGSCSDCLQHFAHAPAAFQAGRVSSVEPRAEPRKGLELLELRVGEPEIAGDRAVGRQLRLAADARDRPADVDRRQLAFLEQRRRQVDLPVGDRDQVGRDVGREVLRLGLDDRQRGQRAAARVRAAGGSTARAGANGCRRCRPDRPRGRAAGAAAATVRGRRGHAASDRHRRSARRGPRSMKYSAMVVAA